MIPTINALMREIKGIKDYTLKMGAMGRRTFLAHIFETQDEITHFHTDMTKKKVFLNKVIENLDLKRETQDQKTQFEHLQGRIIHQDNLIVSSIGQID
jgi:hypothetical protein